MNWSRRRFLGSAVTTGAAWLAPGFGGVSHAASNDRVLVALFLRGGADGLNLVVPAGDPHYYDLRPDIAVAPGSELALDGFYGLHPSLAPLHELYARGELAILHAVGDPHSTRSHFAAQDAMDRAGPESERERGWLNRFLMAERIDSPFSGITLGASASLALRGDVPTAAFPSLARHSLQGHYAEERERSLRRIYESSEASPLRDAAMEALAAVELFRQISTETIVAYPGSDIGRALADVAALVRSPLPLRVVAVEFDGWDLHSGSTKRTQVLGHQLASALSAFYADLGDLAGSTLTLCLTEFGRTASQNGGGGTDHGGASAMLALGGGVRGGRVLTADGWPGLRPGDLFESRDLLVTTDYRDVFAEVLVRHMGATRLDTILPGFESRARNYPGLFA